MGTKLHYQIPIKILALEAGRSYAAAVKIYSTNSAELVKVASLYLNAGSKFKSALLTIEQVLKEIPDGAAASVSGIFFGTEYRRIVSKSNIADVIARKRLSVYMHNSPLLIDRAELFEIAKGAGRRKSSIKVDI
jgi:hypothetical protein